VHGLSGGFSPSAFFISPSPLVYIKCCLLHPSGFPLGFPSRLSTAPWSAEPGLGWRGDTSARDGLKTRGTISGELSSPPSRNLTGGTFHPRTVVNPGFASQVRISSPRAGVPPTLRAGWGGRSASCFHSPALWEKKRNKKRKKNCSGFFFFFPAYFIQTLSKLISKSWEHLIVLINPLPREMQFV